MNTTNSRLAEQSRQKFISALFCVMEQYDFKEITVTQLAQEAGLSRKTFYRLYSTKEDVLNEFFKSVFLEFTQCVKEQNLHHYWDVVQLFFDFWEERRALLMLLKKNGLLFWLIEGSYRYSADIFMLVRSAEAVAFYQPLLPYMLAYAVGGMHNMLVAWVENDMAFPSALLIEKLKTGFQSPDI